MIQNKKEILDFIQENKENILFVGIGNRLRGDDGIGSFLASEGKKYISDKFIDAGISFENYIFKILERNEKIVIIIDALKIQSRFALITVDELIEQGISTHSISLKRFKEMFENFGKKIYILGINVSKLNFEDKISDEVFNRGMEILKEIIQCMS
ncbi:MAG: hypothetical protein DRI36_00645 [Caldiserica bacterium]|nr:MAG: hypothetical protein DRI36_00645 [Caldisericota bacterium]